MVVSTTLRHAERSAAGRQCCIEAKVKWFEISFVAKTSVDDLLGGANPLGDDCWKLAVRVRGCSRFCSGNMAKQLQPSRLNEGSDRRLTCSGADFLIGDMGRELDVQNISQAPLVEGIKTSFGRYNHTPCVGSVEKY